MDLIWCCRSAPWQRSGRMKEIVLPVRNKQHALVQIHTWGGGGGGECVQSMWNNINEESKQEFLFVMCFCWDLAPAPAHPPKNNKEKKKKTPFLMGFLAKFLLRGHRAMLYYM